MSEMVEVVARAISMKLYGGYPVGSNHSREIMAQWEQTKALAREVIEAMRVPTPDMLKAGDIPGWDDDVTVGLAGEIWDAMIDAALREPNEKRSGE